MGVYTQRNFVGNNTADGTILGVSPTTPIGFYGVATPVAQQQVAAVATDLATAQALANSIRTIGINLGLWRA